MIKDQEKAAQLLASFPAMTPKLMDEIERECVQQYLFYRRLSSTDVECFCTHCRERFINSQRDRMYANFEFKHNNYAHCPHCGWSVQLKAMHYGRKTLTDTQLVYAFQAVDGNLYIRYMKVIQYFIDSDELVPEIEYSEIDSFFLAPGTAQKWKSKWCFNTQKNRWFKKFVPLKTENAQFATAFAGWDCINDTFLRYFEVNYVRESTNIKLIQYMITAAKHPNLEYLVKKNMWHLIVDIVNNKNMNVINWRSNNLKRMLRLNKNELDAVEWTVDQLKFHHKWIKREPRSAALIMQIIKNTANYNLYRYLYILDFAPTLSLAKIYKYSRGNIPTLMHWADYLRMAAGEGYDMTDSSVVMPPNLNAAHDRLVDIGKCSHNQNMDKLIKKRNKKLRRLIFSDENYSIVLPKSVQDIVDEGKALSHCVGGYADRHAKGALAILFIRKNDDLGTPFYTMEVANDYHIVQCRGYKNNLANNPKPDEIIKFEEKYAAYLQQIKLENVHKASA